MTYDEITIIELARAIENKQEWENRCWGCKHLAKSTWHIGDRTGKTYHCSHPDRQDGFHDPKPYGCLGYSYERK